VEQTLAFCFDALLPYSFKLMILSICFLFFKEILKKKRHFDTSTPTLRNIVLIHFSGKLQLLAIQHPDARIQDQRILTRFFMTPAYLLYFVERWGLFQSVKDVSHATVCRRL
jgi:hypothetical protein